MRLSADGIVKRYGKAPVLDDVSMVAEAGAVTGLIGPNGSGKSTLFDVLTCFTERDAGTISVDGQAVGTGNPHELAARGLVRTFQRPRVARQMTLMENLMVAPRRGEGESLLRLFSPLHVGRVRRDERERRDRAWEMLRTLGLEHHGNDFADVLSGGQLKLLSVGIAFMMEPDTLLLDEPTAGVNPVLIERIVTLIRSRDTAGRTTLVIEHNISVVAELCSSVYVLDAGKIIAHGTPAEVQSNELVIDAYLGRRVRHSV